MAWELGSCPVVEARAGYDLQAEVGFGGCWLLRLRDGGSALTAGRCGCSSSVSALSSSLALWPITRDPQKASGQWLECREPGSSQGGLGLPVLGGCVAGAPRTVQQAPLASSLPLGHTCHSSRVDISGRRLFPKATGEPCGCHNSAPTSGSPSASLHTAGS